MLTYIALQLPYTVKPTLARCHRPAHGPAIVPADKNPCLVMKGPERTAFSLSDCYLMSQMVGHR